MSKQLDFTEHERRAIAELVKNIGTILLKKMDEGVEAPTLVGSMDIEDTERIVTFEITARNKLAFNIEQSIN